MISKQIKGKHIQNYIGIRIQSEGHSSRLIKTNSQHRRTQNFWLGDASIRLIFSKSEHSPRVTKMRLVENLACEVICRGSLQLGRLSQFSSMERFPQAYFIYMGLSSSQNFTPCSPFQAPTPLKGEYQPSMTSKFRSIQKPSLLQKERLISQGNQLRSGERVPELLRRFCIVRVDFQFGQNMWWEFS